MKKFFSTVHRWLGFPLGLLFVITFGTGCLTAVDELLERVEHTRTKSHYIYRATSIEEDARALTFILEGRELEGGTGDGVTGDGKKREGITGNGRQGNESLGEGQKGESKKEIRQVTLPSKDRPYYHVATRGERWIFPIDHLDQENYSQSNNEGFFRTVLQLHRNYLLGKEGLLGVEGKHYAAWVGLIALMLSLLGLWLWWPLRKSFAIKDLVPRGKKRKHFYFSHMSSGVVLLVVILLLALTGASITYRAITQQLFGVERDKSSNIKPIVLNNNWQAWLQEAYAQMPEGAQLEQIRFPRQAKGGRAKQPARNNADKRPNNRRNKTGQHILEFRFHAPGDWLGLASSKVKIDKNSSQLVDVVLFRDLPLSEKFYFILVPLHTGHNLPAVYVIALLVLSLLGTVMVFSGLVSFVVKKRKWLRTKRLINPKLVMENWT